MRRVRQGAALLAAAAALGVILFLALMSRPEIRPLGLLPDHLARFIDSQYTGRHVFGFLAFHLALLGLGRLAGLTLGTARRARLAGVLALFAATLELAQLPLPRRSVDFSDILASWAGIALAFVLTEALLRGLARFRRPTPPPVPPAPADHAA
jgi:hypothetical protein